MNTYLRILLIVMLAGCEQVSFKEPQPRGRKSLSEIPQTLTGRYLMEEKSSGLSKDTIIVEKNGFHIGYFDPSEREKNKDEVLYPGTLKDSLILKSYKGYYFLNFQDRPEWILRVLRKEKNGDLTLMNLEQDGVQFKDYLKQVATIVKIDSSIVNGEQLYQIDPTRQQLMQLIRKGFFSETRIRKIK